MNVALFTPLALFDEFKAQIEKRDVMYYYILSYTAGYWLHLYLLQH